MLADLRKRQDDNPLHRSIALPPVTDGVAALLTRPVAGLVAAADEWQRACQRQADEPLDEDDLGGAVPSVDAVGPSVEIVHLPLPPILERRLWRRASVPSFRWQL